MKYRSIFLLFAISILISSCTHESPESAKKYYLTIAEEINELTLVYEVGMNDAIDDFVPETMKIAYTKLEKKVLALEQKFVSIDAYFEDYALINQAKLVVSSYKRVLPKYAELIKNESIAQDEYSEENGQIYDSLNSEINMILNKSIANFQTVSVTFGKNHSVSIENTESK